MGASRSEENGNRPIPQIIVGDIPDTSRESTPRPEATDSDQFEAYLTGDVAPKSLRGQSFVPPGVLREFWPRERVQIRLRSCAPVEYSDTDIETTVDVIFGLGPAGDSHLKIYVLLSLLGLDEEVFSWIRMGICDSDLPLSIVNPRPQDPYYIEIRALTQTWRLPDKSTFNTFQSQVDVPFFPQAKRGGIVAREFPDQAVLPFISTEEDNNEQHSILEGGFGRVYCVKMPACCHEFDPKITEISHGKDLFALKIIRPAHQSQSQVKDIFKKELLSLNLFGGSHPHIITLLTAFVHGKDHCLLFPLAKCDLYRLWEITPPRRDFDHVVWMATQCMGLVDALDKIHEVTPKTGLVPPDKKYGRHGDIKSENILVFGDHADPYGYGRLVISDFGTGAIHGDHSKSAVPRTTVNATWRYMSPESNMEGGMISRSYDIWTLGCTFLEMCTWWLGGWKSVKEFEDARLQDKDGYFLDGKRTDAFFAVRTPPGSSAGTPLVFLVKPAVSKWIDRLRKCPNSTQYALDFLTLIHDHMLVVEADAMDGKPPQKRMRTPALIKKLQTFRDKCLRDREYGVTPRRDRSGPVRRLTGVSATVNSYTKDLKESRLPPLQIHMEKIRPRGDPEKDGRN